MKKIKLLFLVLASVIAFAGCKDKEPENIEPDPVAEELDYSTLSAKQLEVLALENDGQAAYYLGLMYDYGLNDVTQNFADSFKWYETSSNLGFSQGSLYLGYAYLNGAGCEVDLEKANECFQKAVDEGCKEGYVGLARCILASGDEEQYSTACDYIETAYNFNLLDGYYYMGYLHEKGYGMEMDIEKAVECYERVLSNGTEDINDQFAINSANTRLGYIYANGLLGEADGKSALSYLKEASEKGFSEANYYLGMMYLRGVGVDKNADKALSYFEEAANKDYAPALSQIAYIYFNGNGVDMDYTQAVYYEKLAAAQGYAPSQINLGYLYENGIGVEKNLETALAYYKLAAENNYEGAGEAVTRVETQLSK